MSDQCFIGEVVREFEEGVVGATQVTVVLYRVPVDTIISINSLCVHNRTGAAQTLVVELGVISGGLFYPHETTASVANTASKFLRQHMHAIEGDLVVARLIGSAANTLYRVAMCGVKQLTR